VVELKREVMEEKDGPMLLHGLQKFNKAKLILPKSEKNWPKQENLEERYNLFRAS
jgi:putative restriction endonuclease